MPLSSVWAHEDVGEQQRDDRVYMSITNDSPNQRTDVTFYYIEFSHPGHDHDWLAPTGVGGCDLGTISPGASATCHSPWHSSKSPDRKPECNPVSDYNFRFMISYNEGGNNKNSAQTNAAVTSVVGDSGTVSGFNWDAHIDQKFLEEPCTLAPTAPDPPGVALEEEENTGVIPDWFKQNAKWWRDGQISDIDIINAIENLISTGTIPLDSFVNELSEDGGSSLIEVTGERTIPHYNKELFGWWADGLVPDSDITNSLGFLISEGIIYSEKIQKEITDIKEEQNGSLPLKLDETESPESILTEFITGSIDIQPVDDEWNSGEEIPVVVNDPDLNINSGADEVLDLFNPDVDHIPTLQTGTPITLKEISDATLGDDTIFPPMTYPESVEPYSDRAFLETPSEGITLIDGDELTLTLGNTFEDFYDSVPESGQNNFKGYNLINYDIRSIFNNANIDSVNIYITDETGSPLVPMVTGGSGQGYLNLDAAGSSFFDLDPNGQPTLIFEFDVGGPTTEIPGNTVMPIVADFFSFGFENDGLEGGERIASQIIRLELEENGDNSGEFIGSLEYIMINQLNVLDPTTYEDLSPIADDPNFIVIEDLTDEDSIRVNYLDSGKDGVQTLRSDQEEAPTHSGIVSFDLDTYKVADTVIITLQDLDLNVDSDLIDIYNTVTDPNDAAFGTIGAPGLGEYSNGDAFGRLLDVTFDDELWTTPQGDCLGDLLDVTGLAATGFTLVETDRDSGSFLGDFQIPDRWCRSDAGSPETTTGMDLEVNYVDFRDASGEIIQVNSDPIEILINNGPPSGDSGISDPGDSGISDPGDGSTLDIFVYTFDFAHYPVAQFQTWRWPGECDDQWHVHTPTGHAVNLGLTGMSDPDLNDCGWGKTSELNGEFIEVPESVVEAFSKKTGTNPMHSTPADGGDGMPPGTP